MKSICDIKFLSFLFFIFYLKSFVIRREWNSFALSFCDKSVWSTIKQNCMFFLSFCQSLCYFQYLRDRKFNETLNEYYDYKFYSLSFKIFAIFFDRTSITWCELSSTMFDYWNKFYKFYYAHRSFFCNN